MLVEVSTSRKPPCMPQQPTLNLWFRPEPWSPGFWGAPQPPPLTWTALSQHWLTPPSDLIGAPSRRLMFLADNITSPAVLMTAYQQLLDNATDTRSKALALSSALPQAGAWLNAIPSTTLGLHLQDKEFRLCLQYWLWLRMFDDGALCPICQGRAPCRL